MGSKEPTRKRKALAEHLKESIDTLEVKAEQVKRLHSLLQSVSLLLSGANLMADHAAARTALPTHQHLPLGDSAPLRFDVLSSLTPCRACTYLETL